jgi:hypothetical protein
MMCYFYIGQTGFLVFATVSLFNISRKYRSNGKEVKKVFVCDLLLFLERKKVFVLCNVVNDKLKFIFFVFCVVCGGNV